MQSLQYYYYSTVRIQHSAFVDKHDNTRVYLPYYTPKTQPVVGLGEGLLRASASKQLWPGDLTPI